MPKARRHIPVARITLLAAVVVAGILLSRRTHEPHFQLLRPGMEFAVMRGDPYCRMGLSEIGVLRLDPRAVKFRVAHYTQLEGNLPLGILDWERRTGALAVFNAGQYYPDYSYMGLLVSRGRAISSKLHPGFKAALVADPVKSGPAAAVVDLDAHPIEPDNPAWREVVQSFMLFDDHGRIRVRNSGQVAYRTVVGEDAQGRVLILATEGGYTLYELAGLLQRMPLGLKQAMSMDGGDEAALCVHAGTFVYASFGHRNPNGDVPNPIRSTVPLPAVVTVVPR